MDRYLPIEEHGIIGDLHTVALVGVDGTIDWCCLPRFDAPAVFGALLDREKGGEVALRAHGTVRHRQLYLPDSNVLMTRYLGEHSVGEVVDFMVPHGAGLNESSADHVIVRRVQAVRGRVRFDLRCRPAFDFARARHTAQVVDGVGAVFESEAGRLVVRTTVPLAVDGDAAVASFSLQEGDTADVLLSWGGRVHPVRPGEAQGLFAATMRYWQAWLRQSRYTGRWREMVERSALCLKLLVHQPSGALVAAPTTSLPEALGADRNWDYRFTWVRDAAFTLYALMSLGFTDEAAAFMDWLEARCRETDDGTGLQVLYGIDGRAGVPEVELDHLDGYRGSRPVRVGNDAANQRQLDIYGELMDSVYLFNKYGSPISWELWTSLSRQLEWLVDHWDQPDDGLWEVRGGRERFTYSAVMTWVAFERAQRLARQRGLPAPVIRWRDVGDRAYHWV